MSGVGQILIIFIMMYCYIHWCTCTYVSKGVPYHLESISVFVDWLYIIMYFFKCVWFFVFNSHIRCWINCKFINVEEICKMLFFMKYLNNFTASFCKLSQTTRVFHKCEGVGILIFFRTKARNAAQTERFWGRVLIKFKQSYN